MGVGESGVESKSTSIDTSLITEANSMDIHRVGTYLILLESWEGAKYCPVDRIGIDGLAGPESRFECWDGQELARLPRHSLF